MTTLKDVAEQITRVETIQSKTHGNLYAYRIFVDGEPIKVTSTQMTNGHKRFWVEYLKRFNIPIQIKDREEWDTFVEWVAEKSKQGVKK